MILITAFGSFDWRAASTAFAPSINATRKLLWHGARYRIVRFPYFTFIDHPAFGE